MLAEEKEEEEKIDEAGATARLVPAWWVGSCRTSSTFRSNGEDAGTRGEMRVTTVRRSPATGRAPEALRVGPCTPESSFSPWAGGTSWAPWGYSEHQPVIPCSWGIATPQPTQHFLCVGELGAGGRNS